MESYLAAELGSRWNSFSARARISIAQDYLESGGEPGIAARFREAQTFLQMSLMIMAVVLVAGIATIRLMTFLTK
jgi:hypothetical protein